MHHVLYLKSFSLTLGFAQEKKYIVTQTSGRNWRAGISPLSSWEQKQFFSPTHADPHRHFMGFLRTERHSALTFFKCFISTEPFPER